ncbi:MAG: adenylate kinase [Deinococcaceae bacterium]
MTGQVMIFLGAPGAGKGTQAERLSKQYGMVKLSTGDILRDHVSRGTALGQRIEPILSSGQLVSDEILIELIEHQVSVLESSKIILDGFPRTVEQAKALDQLLIAKGLELCSVILLDVPVDLLIDRIISRGKVLGRSDDGESTARERQRVYLEQTEPLVDYYRSKGLLKVVAGTGSLDDVYARIVKIMKKEHV